MMRDRLTAFASWLYESSKTGAVVICGCALLAFAIGGIAESCASNANQPPRTSGCKETR